MSDYPSICLYNPPEIVPQFLRYQYKIWQKSFFLKMLLIVGTTGIGPLCVIAAVRNDRSYSSVCMKFRMDGQSYSSTSMENFFILFIYSLQIGFI